MLYSINWPNCLVWLPLLCEIFGNMCIAMACKPICDIVDFVVQIKPFYLDDQKSRDKNLKSWERKELLRWNKKHFLSFLKGFWWANNTIFFKGESPTLKWESQQYFIPFNNIMLPICIKVLYHTAFLNCSHRSVFLWTWVCSCVAFQCLS